MRTVILRMAIATALFAALHSLLASTWAKRQAVEFLGHRDAPALYRSFYVLQAFVLVSLLLVYYRRQPTDELYRVGGGPAWVMRAGQVGAAGIALWAVYEVGSEFMLGLDGLRAWREGAAVPLMHDGQGPAPDRGDAMRATGPFAWVRQPLNLVLLPLLWLNPTMSSRLLGFTLVTTAYVLVGIVHSETHLVDRYGEAYRQYQREVPLLPGVW
jgi:methanethiol S-methyltransferase